MIPAAPLHSEVSLGCAGWALKHTRIRKYPVPAYKTPIFFIKPSVDHDVKVIPRASSEPHHGHTSRGTFLLCSRCKDSAPSTVRGAPDSARRTISRKRNRPKAFLFVFFFALSPEQPTNRFQAFFFPGHTTSPTPNGNRHCRQAARSPNNTSITTRRPALVAVLKNRLARGATTLAGVDRRGWQRPVRLRPLL